MSDKKTPAYQSPDYPFKPTSEPLVAERLGEDGYLDGSSLYELKCPNPECELSIHIRGTRVAEFYDRLQKTGCPECKLQFDGSKYVFKEGERERPQPENDGKYKGFTVRKIEVRK